MERGRTLYVSDLDGTLLQPDARLSATTIRELNKVISEGALFTIATARTPATVAPIVRDLDLRLPAVVMTGTALWEKETNQYSDVNYMNERGVNQLVEIYREMEFPTFLYTLNHDMIDIYHLGRLSEIERAFIAERHDNPYKRFIIPSGGDSRLPSDLSHTILFYGMQPDALAEATFARTSKVEGVRAQKYYDFYGPEIGILEAFSPQSTKARAIKRLAQKIGAERIVAFGDNLNDIPMFEIADLAVAMENGVEQAKRAADLVIEANVTDSVARFIVEDFAKNNRNK